MNDPGNQNDGGPLSRRVYEKLLTAYPEQFRRRYGEEMADLFEDECKEQVEHGRWRLLQAWVRALTDLAAGSAAERRRLIVSFSTTRWCGFLAILGGLLVAVSGLFLAWVTFPLGELSRTALGLQYTGMLLLGCGLVGLVALIVGHGDVASRRSDGADRRLDWTQRAVMAGFLLMLLAIPATAGMMTLSLVYEILGGPQGLSTDSLPADLFTAFGILHFFGLPLAAVLLGVGVWRSGLLGRWRALPIAVGMLTLFAPFMVPAAADAFGLFSWSIQRVVIGLAWTALGLVLLKQEEDETESVVPAEG